MNGMAAKKLRRDHAAQWTDDGVPRDAKDWTKEDWKDLHEAIESVKEKVAKRHAEQKDISECD